MPSGWVSTIVKPDLASACLARSLSRLLIGSLAGPKCTPLSSTDAGTPATFMPLTLVLPVAFAVVPSVDAVAVLVTESIVMTLAGPSTMFDTALVAVATPMLPCSVLLLADAMLPNEPMPGALVALTLASAWTRSGSACVFIVEPGAPLYELSGECRSALRSEFR